MPIVKTVRVLFHLIKALLQRIERFFIYRIFSLNDTPHRIALGVAIGIFITWTPTIGIQMVLTVALSWLLGANKLVGAPFVWISNPATIFPIYGPNYWVGCKVLGSDFRGLTALENAITFNGGFIDRIQAWFEATQAIFWELWVGSLIVGLVLAIITYFAMYRMIVVYRRRLHAWQYKHTHKPADPAEKSVPNKKVAENPHSP